MPPTPSTPAATSSPGAPAASAASNASADKQQPEFTSAELAAILERKASRRIAEASSPGSIEALQAQMLIERAQVHALLAVAEAITSAGEQ